MKIINIRKEPEYLGRGIAYFQEKWANKENMKMYEDSITRSVKAKNPLPIWYLLTSQEKVIGCVGLITNDFISSGDLYPWLCALYVEEDYRGKGLADLLISQVKEDAKNMGYDYLYLCTDLIDYYERYGFKYITKGYHPWGESSSVYEIELN